MTFRAYLTILRPVRTLLFAAFFSWLVGFSLLKPFSSRWSAETTLFTLAVILPLILGALLLGPLLEVMHRSFSVLLPGARLALRRWHIGAVTLSAVLLLIATEFSQFAFPKAAALGLILVGLTLPLLNERTSLSPATMLRNAVILLSFGTFLALPSRMVLISAGRQAPWLFLLIGTTCAILCFRRGFAASRVRARSTRPQLACCFQSIAPLPGSGFAEMMRYVQAENSRLVTENSSPTPDRTWSTPVVGPTLLAWAQVVHHARFGSTPPIGTQLRYFIMGLVPALSFTAIPWLFSALDPQQAVSFRELCSQITDAGGVFGRQSIMLYEIGPTFGVAIAVLAGAVASSLSHPLPISRRRLANCFSIEIGRLAAISCLGFAAGLFAIAAAACLFAGRSLDPALFARPLFCALFVPPLALAELSFLFLAARVRWVASFGFLVVWIPMSATLTFLAAVGLVSDIGLPLGLVGCLAATAATGWLLWFALHRHFRRCDLTCPVPWARTFNAGA